MSYLSKCSSEIRKEEHRRQHPVYDFRKPGRTNVWLPVEKSEIEINWWGRAG